VIARVCGITVIAGEVAPQFALIRVQLVGQVPDGAADARTGGVLKGNPEQTLGVDRTGVEGTLDGSRDLCAIASHSRTSPLISAATLYVRAGQVDW